MARATISVTKEAIADYWLNSEEMDWGLMFIEPEDAHERCWYCGRKTSRLERCHIVPDSLGGKPEPSNMVLLCHSCHLEAPNVSYKEAMLDWLYTSWDKSFLGLYETHQIYNHLKYYEDTYKSNYLNDLNSALFSIYKMNPNKFSVDKITEWVKKIITEEVHKSSNHWGQYYYNDSTSSFTYRKVLERIQKEYSSFLREV